MSLAAILAGFRHVNRHPILILLALPAVLILTSCAASPPATTPANPVTTETAKPAAPKPATAKPSPGTSPAASPSQSPAPVALFEIADATLADATPWVSVRLNDGEPRILSGWRLEVGTQSMVIPGNAIVQPGDMLILHVGDGLSSEREVYLGAESHALALAASPGARVRLVNPDGEVVAETTVPRF